MAKLTNEEMKEIMETLMTVESCCCLFFPLYPLFSMPLTGLLMLL